MFSLMFRLHRYEPRIGAYGMSRRTPGSKESEMEPVEDVMKISGWKNPQ